MYPCCYLEPYFRAVIAVRHQPPLVLWLCEETHNKKSRSCWLSRSTTEVLHELTCLVHGIVSIASKYCVIRFAYIRTYLATMLIHDRLFQVELCKKFDFFQVSEIASGTRKKSPNVHKSCLKMISIEK